MRRILLVLLAASPLYASYVDSRTGLWFPPGVSPDVYLNNSDPKHVYGIDVNAALKDDPQLRDAVCSEAADWQPPFAEAPDPAVRQKRAILAMACSALGFQHREKNEREVRLADAQQKLESALDAAEKPYHNANRADRLSIADGIYFDAVHLNEQEKEAASRAIEAIAVAPDDVESIGLALRFLFATGWVKQRGDADLLLERVYRDRASSSRADRDAWQRGHEQLLLMLGKPAEAAKVRDAVDASSAAPEWWQPTFSALVERVNGNAKAWPDAVANCPKDGDARALVASAESSRELPCLAYAQRLAMESMAHLYGQTPAALLALVKDDASSPHAYLAARSGLALVGPDPATAAVAFRNVLARPAGSVPLNIRLDSIMGLKQLAQALGDHREVIRLSNCYIGAEGIAAPFGADTWRDLATLPKSVLEHDRGEEQERIEQRFTDAYRAAIALDDPGYAERELERLAAYDVMLTDGFLARSLLTNLAVIAWQRQHEDLALSIAGYLLPQPLDERNRQQLVDGIPGVERNAKPTEIPWSQRLPAKEDYGDACGASRQ